MYIIHTLNQILPKQRIFFRKLTYTTYTLQNFLLSILNLNKETHSIKAILSQLMQLEHNSNWSFSKVKLNHTAILSSYFKQSDTGSEEGRLVYFRPKDGRPIATEQAQSISSEHQSRDDRKHTLMASLASTTARSRRAQAICLLQKSPLSDFLTLTTFTCTGRSVVTVKQNTDCQKRQSSLILHSLQM